MTMKMMGSNIAAANTMSMDKIRLMRGDRVGIVCCSNAQLPAYRQDIDKLSDSLAALGIEPVFSEYIYGNNSVFSGSARERADALMRFYADASVRAIYDISGGDIANEILPYLDYSIIRESGKLFWGYSDLTTVINAIYAESGVKSVFYQIKNLVWDEREKQLADYKNSVLFGADDLFSLEYEFVQGEELEGILVGGNIRCLLKLAGTRYFPDMRGRVLLLEALGGTVPQMVTYLNQLKQLGVFDKISGILLGTFTTMEKEGCQPAITELVKEYAGTSVPIARTGCVGHGRDAKAIIIGEEIRWKL